MEIIIIGIVGQVVLTLLLGIFLGYAVKCRAVKQINTLEFSYFVLLIVFVVVVMLFMDYNVLQMVLEGLTKNPC